MSQNDPAEKLALLFQECVEIADPARRSALLDAACGGDGDLRRRMEALLQAHEASGRFLGGGTPPSSGDTAPGAEALPPEFRPGSQVGPYRLIGQIGEGGTSTVFVAEQEEPVRRWVALKLVKPGMDTRKVLWRFGLERQALALMDHPGIAKLLDAGATSSGHPFFVMELVPGVAITRFCDEHQLTLLQRLDLFLQVCNAVLHAHQRGIIHRDLKPDNILVAENGGKPAVKIIDFGIAKALRTADLTNTGRTGATPLLGTPAYMSPEQAGLSTPDVDTRADIYSLGAVLYELLSGHPPFEHRGLMEAGLEEMCRIIRTVDPPAPSQRLARLPTAEQAVIAADRGTSPLELVRLLTADLDWIALKALEKVPERRYPTAASLADDITRHLEHLPVSAVAPSRRYRLAKLLRRNRSLVVTTATIAVLVVASALLSAYLAVDARLSATHARKFEQAATVAGERSHRAMVAMHVSSGLSAAEDRANDKAVLWFAKAADVAGPGDEQSQVNARRALCWMTRVSIPLGAFRLPSACQTLEFSADSQYLLAHSGTRHWQLWDARTQEPVRTTVSLIQTAAWGPRRDQLATVIPDGEVRVCEVTTGAVLHSFRVSPTPVAVGFTPDGRYLVAANALLHVFDLHDHGRWEVLPAGAAAVGLAFSGRPTRLVVATDDSRARVVSLPGESDRGATGAREFPHRYVIRTDACSNKSNYREDFLNTARLSLPAVAADGNRLITRTGSYAISFWDLASGAAIHRINDVCCSCRFITSPETGLLACGLQGGKVSIWDVATAAQRQLLPSRGACILDIAFGSAGKHLITADANGIARLWSVNEGQEIQSPLHHCMDVDRVAFAPDGRRVATAQSDGLVRIWNVLDVEPDRHAPAAREVPTVVRMDAAGRKFVLTKEPRWDARIRELAVYSVTTGERISPTVLLEGSVETAAFSPDGRLLAAGVAPLTDDTPARIEFRDAANLRLIGQPVSLPSSPVSIAWSPADSAVAVICREGELMVIRRGPTHEVKWSVPAPPGRSRVNLRTEFTRDGRDLVSLGIDGAIDVRDAASGQLRYHVRNAQPDGFWSFALSQQSHYIATMATRGDVTVWKVEDGVQVGPVLRHPGWVYRCRFSSDHQRILTASHDGKVRIWDWQSGALLGLPLVHPGEVYDASFTPDNRWVLTACRDGHVRTWDPGTGQLLAPPLKVGRQAFDIRVSPDGEYAVIGSLGQEVAILSLGVLQKALPYDTSDLCLLAEVLSGCTVQNGALRDLTTEEWMQRYQEIRTLHPEVFRSGQSYGLERRMVPKPGLGGGAESGQQQ